MTIEFKRLPEIEKSEIIDLMNNELIRKQMPLFTGDFDNRICEKFIASKELLWTEHGYGPWAFIINDKFAGWGGLQPENGEADLALVLHPNYWGKGKYIYKKIIEQAFGVMELKSITILFPPSRTRVQELLRLGFKKEENFKIDGIEFIKYRLINTTTNNMSKI
jgi:hypothetical protein